MVETPVENRSADNEKYVSKSDLNSSLIEILNKTSTDTSFEIFFTSISDTILSTIRGISKISFYLVDQKIRTIQLLGQFDSRLKYISAIEGGEELEIIRGFDETILGLTAEAGEPSSTGTQQMVEYDGNEICIPIKFNNVTIGLIQAEREICEYFTNKDIKFFSYFANAIGGFMKSKLLSQQLSRSEVKLLNLKSYHQTILDNLPIGIIGLKHDSQIDYSNQYIQSFMAKPLKGRLIQEILSDLFDETIAYSILTALEESFKEERGFSLNEIPIVLNEIQKKLNIVFIPLFDQSEKIFRGLLIIDDDTESYTLIDRLRSAYKQIEERQDHIMREVQQKTEFQRKLLSTTKELRQKHKEMESFIYSVSHDLKTPIVSIQGYISALLEEMGESSIDNSKIYLERIRKNADYSSKLIRDILEYSRIGQEELNIQEVISLEIIHSAVNTIKSQIGVKEFKIEIQTAPYPKIICQAERIHQVFVNLIHNAFKYRNKSLKDPYLLISMEEEEKFWVFVFTDNGVGLSENQRDKMFIMFERGYDSFSESIEGSGIGLAFSKKIVEIHNGRITVDSEKGIGSTFRIWLPKKASFQKGRIY
ncbi:MAG: ATP-binding protein [Candidatus Hodarchaeales archaeon]